MSLETVNSVRKMVEFVELVARLAKWDASNQDDPNRPTEATDDSHDTLCSLIDMARNIKASIKTDPLIKAAEALLETVLPCAGHQIFVADEEIVRLAKVVETLTGRHFEIESMLDLDEGTQGDMWKIF